MYCAPKKKQEELATAQQKSTRASEGNKTRSIQKMKKVGGVEKAAKVLFFGRLLDINVREHYETNERDIYRAKAH